MARTDVCLILEGSYPYVVGGVSTWTHHLIRNLPDISFSIVYIGVSKHTVQKMEYRLPDNVKQFSEVYLLDPVIIKGTKRRFRRTAWRQIEAFIHELEKGDISRFDAIADLLTAGDEPIITPYDILYSRRFFDIIAKLYRKHFPDLSFLDYFWTCRFLMLPIFQLLYANLPEASLYHATCTGYAGLLASLGKKRHGASLALTEHGIYTRERMIEISQSPHIYNEVEIGFVPRRSLGLLQGLWMNKFRLLSKIVYDEADSIITLYGGNQRTQIRDGADPSKCRIIPNGIDVHRYAELGDKPKSKSETKHVALVGRISPIKDVKTYIRAARLVIDRLEDVVFYVLGTPDEDVEYYEECRALAELMELGDGLRFMGNVDMSEYYPMLDVLVLTSVSEAQPFVLIEAMAVGVPCVATNVGGCFELLYGGDAPGDRELGAAGVVTNVNSPEETADRITELLTDDALADRMAQAGRARALGYYQRQSVIDKYRELYETAAGRMPRSTSQAAEPMDEKAQMSEV